jgi:hypothetical protein
MNEIYKQVANKLGLSKKDVELVYKMYCSLIREKIEKVDIDNIDYTDTTKGEGSLMSFNLTRLGKIYLNKNKIKRKNEVKHKEN